MNLEEFKLKLFAKAEEAGFSEYEIYYSKDSNLVIESFEREIDKYSVSSSMGLCFRGIFKGKMGYANTEILDEAAIDMLISSTKANAKCIENEDEEFIYGERDRYSVMDSFNETLEKVPTEDKINLVLTLEDKSKTDKVSSVGFCGIEETTKECKIINSKGLDLSFKSNFMFTAVSPVVTSGENMYDGLAFKISQSLDEVNINELAEEAIEDALSKVGGSSVPSGKYKIALRYDAASDLLRTFVSIFNADNVQKGLSLLKNKLNTKVASEIVTLVDNPLLENSICSMPFDAEGVATYRKNVIEKGNLNTLLYNLKTAAKDGVKTTANASKVSYDSAVQIAPSNFYFEPGEKSFPQVVEYVKNGLLITSLQGLHAGANPVTGDFSLAANGFLIEDGKVGAPVEQITVASNFYDLLNSIEIIGNDLKFGIPHGSGNFGSPTLVIKEISVAGN